ncbi:hypothetical protein BU26DRAFT_593304 [Trematosphaeria pertusa]|uniref:Uncharacterized protein n=1 Tax=Trematosphaeria pertusa TaxID=390896 RepID=A0A6A6II27_9PLEO|nr:uncharacterized protein BU26DRAFT_593304 [Trematosphaeria pertusa]KAF2249859.1 hypothetical protein BU26DRAFT_593304 [Trematosphaeria pertusa]
MGTVVDGFPRGFYGPGQLLFVDVRVGNILVDLVSGCGPGRSRGLGGRFPRSRCFRRAGAMSLSKSNTFPGNHFPKSKTFPDCSPALNRSTSLCPGSSSPVIMNTYATARPAEGSRIRQLMQWLRGFSSTQAPNKPQKGPASPTTRIKSSNTASTMKRLPTTPPSRAFPSSTAEARAYSWRKKMIGEGAPSSRPKNNLFRSSGCHQSATRAMFCASKSLAADLAFIYHDSQDIRMACLSVASVVILGTRQECQSQGVVVTGRWVSSSI